MGGFPCIRFSGPAQPAGGAERIRNLYSVGVQPSVFLNTWEKWAEETKPTSSPISETLFSGSASSSLACRQRSESGIFPERTQQVAPVHKQCPGHFL